VATYYWRDYQARPPQDRFPDDAVGYREWAALVDTLERLPVPQADPAACRDALDVFMAAVAPGAPVLPTAPECNVFVSHRAQKPDEQWAEQIAWHVTQHGYGYWLDVDDPTLTYLNGSNIPSPAREILIAAAIEIALLNCSHIIAVITTNSAGSKWIPYEFGRAKARRMVSRQSSIWLDNGVTQADCGEYVYLSPAHASTSDIETWLRQEKARAVCRAPRRSGWQRTPNPYPLPN
jgi:hypothetical protein